MRARAPLAFLLRAAALGFIAGAFAFLVIDAVAPAPEGELRSSYSEAVERAAPAVVNIYSARRVQSTPPSGRPLFDEFFGHRQGEPELRTSLGSGVILDPDGHLVTNHHVVAKADHIEVVLADGRRLPAERVGSDPETDLAVLRIEAAGLEAIEPAPAGHPEVGDVVLALGNPYGVGRAVTLGIVGATGRDRLGLSTFEDFIQHDAAINPGNSGGPLIDPAGRLVGINTAMFSRSDGSHGIGFAIPSGMVMEVMRQIRSNGKVIRGWLGVHTEDADPQPTAARVPGLRVTGVFAGGPADRAGLERGDILLRVAGTDLPDVETLLQVTTETPPGTKVDIVLRRDGERRHVEAELEQRPSPG